MLTVDVAVAGVRERDVRNRFSVPPRLTARALLDGVVRPRWSAGFVARPRISPGNLPAIGGRRRGPRAVRQPLLRPDRHLGRHRDAARALGRPAGDQGDHARRRCRSAPSSTASTRSSSPTTAGASSTTRRPRSRRCPAIAEVVGDRAELYLDSGVRRGTDIIKALALGARAVLVGRPLVYGLGAAGEAGVRRALELLRAELATSLALAGYPRISGTGARRALREVAFLRLPVRGAARAVGVLSLSRFERRLWSSGVVRERRRVGRGTGPSGRSCWESSPDKP